MDSISSDAARDGSICDEAIVLSVTSALAKDALSYFQSGKFHECIDILIQLNHKKRNDPKVCFFFSFLFNEKGDKDTRCDLLDHIV